MTPTRDGGSFRFIHAGTLAGRLVADDPFKPYLCPLRTPAGHDVTIAMPGDHRHHKGLMYALRAADLNFWEENPGSADCGVQRIVDATPSAAGLRLSIRWEALDGSRATCDEIRTIACRHVPDRNAFLWSWHSHRTALRDHQLIQSEWSARLPDGRRINYHGLGIRLPWSWSFPGDAFNGVETDGTPSTAGDACGCSAREVAWWGLIDGHWSPPRARVAFRQDLGFSWFTLKGGFAYLATGPSALGTIGVPAGSIQEESYAVEVADIPAPHA